MLENTLNDAGVIMRQVERCLRTRDAVLVEHGQIFLVVGLARSGAKRSKCTKSRTAKGAILECGRIVNVIRQSPCVLGVT